MATIPEILGRLKPCPQEGRHRWIMHAARLLTLAGKTDSEIEAVIRAQLTREPQPNEIQAAIEKARGGSDGSTRQQGDSTREPRATAPRWPKCNPEQREAVLSEMGGFGLGDLWDVSPIRCESLETNARISELFPADSLLCCGTSNSTATTKPLASWLAGDMSKLQFLVPSPMSKLTGTNQKDKLSPRCLDNTGARRFLVMEADSGTKHEQAAILRWLSAKAPLVLACSSGGKSLHGWFSCAGASENALEQFFALACQLGADAATWTRCQLVRMPDGTRDTGFRQVTYFFNPQILPK